MGLDITAYSGLEKLNAKLDDNEEAIDAATGATPGRVRCKQTSWR